MAHLSTGVTEDQTKPRWDSVNKSNRKGCLTQKCSVSGFHAATGKIMNSHAHNGTTILVH